MKKTILVARAESVTAFIEKQLIWIRFGLVGVCAGHNISAVEVEASIEFLPQVVEGQEYILCFESDLRPIGQILKGRLIKIKNLEHQHGFL